MQIISEHNKNRKLITKCFNLSLYSLETYFKFLTWKEKINHYTIIFLPLWSDKKCLIHFFIWFKTKKDQSWKKLIFLFFRFFSSHLLASNLKLSTNPRIRSILCSWLTKISYKEVLLQSDTQDSFLISCTNLKSVLLV